MDSYSNLYLDHLFSEMFFQNEKSYQIQNSEIACMETQNNELTLKEYLAFTSDIYELEFEGNFENHIMVSNPYEYEGVIYERSEPINGNHVSSVEFDENFQQPFHYLCDKEYEDNYVYVSSDCSFFDFLFQDQICEYQSGVPIELHGEIYLDIHHAHELDVVVQEHTNYVYDVDHVNGKKEQITVIYFESDLKIEGIK